ncbi:MAG: hypothetical protein ABR588_04670 [Sphingomicrobium sp.]|nr:hypothetical protein [Sphingomonadales bacterium]
MALAAADGTDESARAQFSACLKTSIEKGTAAKIAPDGFTAFAKESCAAQQAGFRSALIAYDVKAGWTRKKAEPDADSQIGDYLADWGDRYKAAQSSQIAKTTAAAQPVK